MTVLALSIALCSLVAVYVQLFYKESLSLLPAIFPQIKAHASLKYKPGSFDSFECQVCNARSLVI